MRHHPPYAAGLLSAYLADNAVASAGNLLYWRDSVGGGTKGLQWGPGGAGRDFGGFGATHYPVVTANDSPDGHHNGLRVSGVNGGVTFKSMFNSNFQGPSAANFTEAEIFVALRSNTLAGVGNAGMWQGFGGAANGMTFPWSDENIYDDMLTTNPYSTISGKGAQLRAGCIYNVRVTSGNAREVRLDDVQVVSQAGVGLRQLHGATIQMGQDGSYSYNGSFFGMLIYNKVLPSAGIRTEVTRWLDRRCGMAIGI